MSNLELGEETGTSEVTLTESKTRTGLTTAAFEADITVCVGNEGQFTQGFGEVDGTVFTIAVVKGVGSVNNTIEESIDGLVGGPSTADDVVSSIRCKIIRITDVSSVTSD